MFIFLSYIIIHFPLWHNVMYTVFPRPYDIRNAEKWVESWNVATKMEFPVEWNLAKFG